MTDVIEFPSRAVRNWERFRPSIEDVLAQSGMPREGIEAVSGRMREAWLSYDQDYSISMSLPIPGDVSATHRQDILEAVREGFTEFERKVQGVMNRVLLDRLKLEIELYFAQNRHG